MAPPSVTRDEDFARAILWRAGIGVFVASAGGFAVRVAQGSPADAGTVVGVVVMAACAATAWLLHTHRVRPATVLFLSVSWLMVAGISLARGSGYVATLPLYLLVTLLAGLLLSTRAAIVCGALSSAATAALIVANDLGALPQAPPIGLAYRVVSAVVALIVVTLTFVAALRRLQTALAQLALQNIELERTRASLEETVAARTRSLVEARDAAEAASRTKTAFLANMSHELRTPMNAVLGMTDVLLQSELTPAQRSMLETIRGGGDALLALLNDVLDMSAVEAGRLAVEERPFEPRAVAADVKALLQADAARAGIGFSVHVDAEVPAVVLGDPRRLRQVLLNLVGNALKFTERGSVSLRVSVRAPAPSSVTEGAGARLQFDVVDTGIGIEADDLERIFVPFTQIDATPTRKNGGSGLGLAISQQLAQLMRGAVMVESQPGRGSTFTLDLPLEVPRIAEPTPAPAPPRAPLPVQMRILIAEDNEVNVRVLERMLSSLGLRADVVGTGAAALRAVREQSYDCVLMDVHMPEMDGIEATRRIRAELAGGGPPVVAVTADALPEQSAAFTAAGIDEVVAKPLLVDALAAALSRAAARSAARRVEALDA